MSINDSMPTAVITGGSGVLGQALVHALARAKIRTAIIGRTPGKAEKLAAQVQQQSGTPSMGTSANVLDRASLELARDTILEKWGQIDYLVNGAGGNAPGATTKVETLTKPNDLNGSFFDLDLGAFATVFDLNFTGTLLPTTVFAPAMVSKQTGVIINISSMNSFRPLTKIPAYSAAKAAINNFTQWLAVHLAPTGVRVNGIAPGFFLTDQNRFLLTDKESGELTARGRKILAATPMGRFGEPNELCGTLLYLVSDSARFVTGITIAVDGGFSAYSGV